MTTHAARRHDPILPGETLDGVLGQPVPASWDDVEYALKATGRAQLTADDRTGAY
jgi:hypothetical protein